MKARYDDALPRLVQIVHGWPGFAAAVDTVAVVRDLKGRLHLVGQPRAGHALADADALEARLSDALGLWFRSPIRWTTDPGPRGGLARGLLERAGRRWPKSWPSTFDDGLGGVIALRPADAPPGPALRWAGTQRLLAKEEWLSDQQATPPWPARADTPLVASFFSYKGGVGRSTLVAVLASRLVREGRHVVIVDLDLEAPGQSSIFGQAPAEGVVDYLLEAALGAAELSGIPRDVTADRIGGGARTVGSLRLVPAGGAGWSLLEKLARLDYLSAGDGSRSPVAAGLRALLKAIRKLDPAPDYILLDARSGLHDLGGLSLHALAHVDVLVMRDDAQSREGMAIALRALWQRTPPEELRVLVVEGMARPSPTEAAAATGKLRDDLHPVFAETVYSTLDAPPQPEDTEVPHDPLAIPRNTRLEHLERAVDVYPALLDEPWVGALLDRLHALVGR